MKKEICSDYFENKKVTVMGLGLLGRGLGDTVFLANNRADLIVTDKKTKEQLDSSLRELEVYKNIKFTLGEHKIEDFENRDFILKTSGVPLDDFYIKHAVKNNIKVYMSAALLCDIVMKNLPNTKVIGVTGTRGKSTVTQMIAHILRASGKNVHLGGNIRGVANLPILKEIEDGDYLVLELDSWQLQGFGEMKISPNIAVFTSFMDDHMNYYHNDRDLYFNDKANIYRFQKDLDVLIVSEDVKEEIEKRDKDKDMIVAINSHIDTNLIGEHNQIAAKLAYEVAAECYISDSDIREAVKTFKAVNGRLEDLGQTDNGVKVFNDNNATTASATIKALIAINETFKIKPILIMGGSDKNLPLSDLEKEILDNAKEVIYLSGTGTDKISIMKKYEFERLEDCISKAFEIAKNGDIVLFSPGFASFSKYFNNEYERNDEFVKQVQKYIKKSL